MALYALAPRGTSDYASSTGRVNQEHTITCCCYVIENITETALNPTNKIIKKELAKSTEAEKRKQTMT